MTDLTSLPKITSRLKKRVGRGHGGGKVKTAGRGTKGQKAREKTGLKFAGSSLQASWLKRLPLWRGRGKNKSFRERPAVVNVKYLNLLKPKTEVTLKTLQEAGIVDKNIAKVKILGDGELTTPLTIKLPCSKGAIGKIEKAGGKVVS
jgi:large subunit ribosomal protein L15